MKFYQTIKQLPEARDVSDEEINRIWREYHGRKVRSTVILSFFAALLLGAIGAGAGAAVLSGFGVGIGGLFGALVGGAIFRHARISDIQFKIRNGEIQLNR